MITKTELKNTEKVLIWNELTSINKNPIQWVIFLVSLIVSTIGMVMTAQKFGVGSGTFEMSATAFIGALLISGFEFGKLAGFGSHFRNKIGSEYDDKKFSSSPVWGISGGSIAFVILFLFDVYSIISVGDSFLKTSSEVSKSANIEYQDLAKSFELNEVKKSEILKKITILETKLENEIDVYKAKLARISPNSPTSNSKKVTVFKEQTKADDKEQIRSLKAEAEGLKTGFSTEEKMANKANFESENSVMYIFLIIVTFIVFLALHIYSVATFFQEYKSYLTSSTTERQHHLNSYKQFQRLRSGYYEQEQKLLTNENDTKIGGSKSETSRAIKEATAFIRGNENENVIESEKTIKKVEADTGKILMELEQTKSSINEDLNHYFQKTNGDVKIVNDVIDVEVEMENLNIAHQKLSSKLLLEKERILNQELPKTLSEIGDKQADRVILGLVNGKENIELERKLVNAIDQGCRESIDKYADELSKKTHPEVKPPIFDEFDEVANHWFPDEEIETERQPNKVNKWDIDSTGDMLEILYEETNYQKGVVETSLAEENEFIKELRKMGIVESSKSGVKLIWSFNKAMRMNEEATKKPMGFNPIPVELNTKNLKKELVKALYQGGEIKINEKLISHNKVAKSDKVISGALRTIAKEGVQNGSFFRYRKGVGYTAKMNLNEALKKFGMV